ncbi:MAG TPA: PAC2 family protein [Nitrososphaerales archaeon]|nr:PAC2 family protein [Nitrososphaerales archaeon]
MWNRLEVFSEPVLSRDPLLIVSVSTSIPQYRILYSQARELASYLLRKLDFQMFSSMYSSAMPPAIGIEKDGIAGLVGVNFYYNSAESRDVVLFAGYSSPASDEYEYASEVLAFAKKLGIKQIVSIGPRWSENPISPFDSPEVLGFASDLDGVRWLEENGVKILKNENSFYFSNLIVPLASLHGMRAFKLSVNHGEPLPHPKSSMSFLKVLSKLGIRIDTSDLVEQAKELEEGLKKAGISGVGTGQIMGQEEEGEEEEEETEVFPGEEEPGEEGGEDGVGPSGDIYR